jgi:hypothetical protein
MPVSGPRSGHSADAPTQPTLFLLRPEAGEINFPATYQGAIDGSIILGRLIADRDGSPAESNVESGIADAANAPSDQLARAARSTDLVNLHDPDTPVLAHLDSHKDSRASRACRMAAALAVDLPVRAEDLRDAELVETLNRATLRAQVGVTRPSPAYFEFSAIDDPWLEGNLALATSARVILPGRDLAVFVRGSLTALRSGALAASAERYRRVLPPGTWAVLGAAGLHPEVSPAEALAAYLEAVIAFRAAGFEVIADRVDHFGPAVVAAGALGIAGGPRIYRVIPPGPFWENEWSVKIRLKCAIPIRGDRMVPEKAIQRRARGSIESCPITDCRALDTEVTNAEIRAHYGHLTQLELDEARRHGLAWVARRYEDSPLKAVRRLGEAVRIAIRRVQAA